jgi:hypothetical protein
MSQKIGIALVLQILCYGIGILLVFVNPASFIDIVLMCGFITIALVIKILRSIYEKKCNSII